MAGRIKGITVEIGGDTTGLEKALKNVNSTIKNTQSQLKDVNRLLKLDPGNTELITQKQRALKDAIGATSEKLETLKLFMLIPPFPAPLRSGWMNLRCSVSTRCCRRFLSSGARIW